MAHKLEYENFVVEPSRSFVAALNQSNTLKKLGLKCTEKSPLFRLNRDLRFSANKDPYKTHNGIVLSSGGKRKENGVFYFHLEPKNCFVAMGFWQPDPRLLALFRLWSVENPQKAKSLVKKLKSKDLEFEKMDSLKRHPKGFEHIQDSEIMNLLRLKHWITERSIKDVQIEKGALVKVVEDFCKDAAPLLAALRPIYEKFELSSLRLE